MSDDPSMKKNIVHIAHLADPTCYVTNQRFEDAAIMGPAVVMIDEDVHMTDVVLFGDGGALVVIVPKGKLQLGIIGLKHVTFTRCEFHNVAFAVEDADEFFRMIEASRE